MRRLLLLLILGAAAALAPAAGAMPPERFGPSEGTESDPHFNQCDGFEIGGVFTNSVKGTVFFDKAGEAVRVLIRQRAEDLFTNSVSGKTVLNRGFIQVTLARIPHTDDFTETVVGHDFLATSPGDGIVLQDVGRIVFPMDTHAVTLFQAGKHIAEAEFGDLVCAALA
jgi:hypothetical protein